jgi:putative membrane protein
MKNKMTATSRFTIAVTVLGALCFAGNAFAINFFPKRTPKPTSSASPAASAGKTATTKTESAAGTLTAKDKAFMRKAAKGGMMEVAMGKMAGEKGQSEDVKAFGKRMVVDHSKANDELMALAEKKGVKLPAEKPAKEWTSDKDYMSMMVKDHEKDLAEFQNEASNGSDPDLKKFAERTAKVVQKHLDLAKETQGKLQ